MSFVRLLQSIGASYENRSEIVGRMMGAKNERSADGIQLQLGSYLALHARLANDTGDIQRQANAASRELQSMLNTERRAAAQDGLRLWLQNGIPQDSKAFLLQNGMAVNDVTAVEDASKVADISNQCIAQLNAPAPGAVDSIIRALAAAFVAVGDTTVAEAEVMRSRYLGAV